MANICSVPKSGALRIYIRTCVPIYFLYNCLFLYFAPFLFGKCFQIKISFRQRGKAHFQIFTLPQQQWKANATVCSGPRWFSSLFQRWRHQFKNVQLIRSRCREHGAGNVSASPVSFPAARFPLISRQAGKVIVFAGCSLFWGDTPTRRIPPPPPATAHKICTLPHASANLFPFRLCHFGNFGPRGVYAICESARAEIRTSQNVCTERKLYKTQLLLIFFYLLSCQNGIHLHIYYKVFYFQLIPKILLILSLI